MLIGQEIKAKEDKQIETLITEKILNIKKGDNTLITKDGIKYTTGEAKGKYEYIEDKIEGYDTDNIAKRITDLLVWRFNLQEYFDDYEIDKDDFIECISEELEQFI